MTSIAGRGLLLAAALLTAGCAEEVEREGWEIGECTADQLEFVDHAIAEANYASGYVEDAIAAEYGEDEEFAPLSAVLDHLARVRTAGQVLCARRLPDGSENFNGWAATKHDAIVVNVEFEGWQLGKEGWEQGRGYGDRPLEEVADLAAGLDAASFAELRDQAYGYLVGPARASGVLVHEAAHLEEPDCCHHSLEEPFVRDRVHDLGSWTTAGVYWERWVPESCWLDEQFQDSR